MSYHGYLPIAKQFLHSLQHAPAILEIGVDRGVSFLTLTTFLARTRPEFISVGVDVLVQEQVNIMLANLDLVPKQQAYIISGNSLEVLPRMAQQGMKFDLVMLDGDHNYHTLSREMSMLEKLLLPHSVIIADDYDGRWSDRDLWYADREGYEKNENVTKKVETERHGVKPAIDEWLLAHPEWNKVKPIPGEPILLTKQNI